MIYLDTHVVVWLYLGDLSNFSPAAKHALNAHDLKISPMVALELTYLQEIERVRAAAKVMLEYLIDRIGLQFCDLPFDHVIDSAMKQTWTRDPFDRIIVGQAAVQHCELLTKDEVIRANYAYTIW
ncbi:PIN domain-containing protein [candidate division KSB3 bacterium]|uniref:PIN domain-containing protein n=1 Tax=candidate division KSB3 bacterium TaxID=2044937 RepID=A0A9D5JTD9_9BACT|nr:PIN domain-containing protein [candidate division KSB3 bacterium]MBD3323276.1 PIN domain-containing protein [candidate division KSB3 bacterium]